MQKEIRDLEQENEPKSPPSIDEGTDYGQAYLVLGQTEITQFGQIGRRYVLPSDRVCLSCTKDADIPVASVHGLSYTVYLLRDKEGWRFENRGQPGSVCLNDFPSEEQRLREGDLLKIGDNVFHFLEGVGVLSRIYEEMSLATRIDLHTRAYNRAHFHASIEDWVNLSSRYNQPLSLLIMDIDHFKKVNDAYGHSAGDAVLKGFEQLVSQRSRKGDVFCRIGGEEFALILPRTQQDQAIQVAENIRQEIASKPIAFMDAEKEVLIPITVSIGVAEYKKPMSKEDLISQADKLAYTSKHTGRNKVSFS